MNLIRLLKVRNEADVIDENIEYYAAQGIPSIVLDNDSDDGTYELCASLVAKGAVSRLERLATEGFDRERILSALDRMCEECAPDAVIVADADEFMESPKQGQSLVEGIHEQLRLGFNLIQIASMEFWMTELDDPKEQRVIKRMRHYSFFPTQHFRIYRFVPGTSLVTYNNHAPDFPIGHQVRLADDIFITKHYKFRSLSQARAKIRRVVPYGDKRDVGFHHINFSDDPQNFVIPVEKLTRYDNDKNWRYEVTYSGGRMGGEELKKYLGLRTNQELEAWFKSKNPFFRELPNRYI